MEGATAEIDREVDEDDSAAGGPTADESVAPRHRSRIKQERRTRAVRALLALVAVIAALGAVAVARGDLDEAEASAAEAAEERAGAEAARDAVEARELATLLTQEEVEALRAAAGTARDDQKQRLRDLGLTEFTVDRFLERVRGNAGLVEWERDTETALVDLQAQQIPELDRCVVAARQAINSAFNQSIDPGTVVPSPTDVCLALLDG